VFPAIVKQYPDAVLDIAGSNPPPEVVALNSPRITVHGFVSDEQLGELYNRADLVVAPLRYGAGVKGKVIEAMARGVPVATTSFGAQGIPNASALMFVGNTSAELLDAVIEALAKRETARRRAARALDFIAEKYSEGALTALFKSLISNAKSYQGAEN
jgi:glycosyltransferase involved in cell wall biosynthesis